MEWSCQLLTLPEPVIQSMNFRRLSPPFESWLFLRLIMTVFKFKSPECHLHNQVGKRSNSNNFANLGNTEKFDVIKMIILLLVAFDSVLFSHMFSLASVLLRKPWNFLLYFTQGKWLDSLVLKWNTLVLWIEIWFSGCRRQSYCRCAAADVSFIWKESPEFN